MKVNLDFAMEDLISIKSKVTADELSRLNIDTFNPSSSTKCLLGQLTYHCNNSRAHKLVTKRYKHHYSEKDNETPGDHSSAIEQYLIVCTVPGEKAVINYILGKIETIDLARYIKN